MKTVALLLVVLLSAATAAAQTDPPVYQPGQGITSPKLLREVKPNYPPSAVTSGVTGRVVMSCVVLPEGSCGEIKITSSLDPVLDKEAIRALQQWRFVPGTKDGRPVPVIVSIEMSFSTKESQSKDTGPLLDSPDVSKAGPGVTLPQLVHEVKPSYPDDARSLGIHGTVTMDCIVLADGTVGRVRVVKGLDVALDEQAVKALKQWTFKPGSKEGHAVPVQITVEMTFAQR